MTHPGLNRTARGYAGVVGAMDFATGLALVAAPAFTLALMRAEPVPAGAAVFVRFVGCFVGAVGASYLWAALRARPAELRATLIVTMFFRGAAGGFAAAAVSAGLLGAAWLSVALTDLACVAVQAGLLAKGVGRDG